MPKKTNSKRKNKIFMAVFLLINLLVVGYIAYDEYRKESDSFSFINLSEVKWQYLLFGLLCFLVAVFAMYLCYNKMMMVATGHKDSKGALECAMLGKYYDNVTPFGAGGQPFQMIYLKQRGYSGGACGAVPIVGFLTQQFAFLLVALVVFIANPSVINQSLFVRVQAYVGFAFYAFVPLMILFFAALPKPFITILKALVGLLHKIKIVKDKDAAVLKVTNVMNDYVSSLKLMKKRIFFLPLLLLFSVVYQVAILSIPFFALRAFGGSGDFWNTFSLVTYIYAAITIVPSPGNAGAAEGYFYAVFSQLKEGYLFWAVIVWRFLVYYSWILIGFIFSAKTTLSNKRHMKKIPPKDRPLNVALFIDTYFPHVDGVTRTVAAYAEHLKERFGGYVCVICPTDKKFDYSSLPYDVYSLHTFRLPFFKEYISLPIVPKKVKKMFKEKQIDIVHCHSPFIAGAIGEKLGRKFDIPVFTTFHSKYYDDVCNITHSKFLARIVVNVVLDFYYRCDKVYACSSATAETLKSYGYAEKVGVLENGVEPIPPMFNLADAKERVLEEYSLPQDKKIILFAGQLVWHKGLRLVLDTFRLLENEGENYFLVIAGAGYNGEEVRAYAKELNLKNILFTGGLNKDAIYGLYECADLFFFPSVYDNAPLVVREAALSRLPALLRKGTNAAEIVTDGENGYVEEGDAEKMAEKIKTSLADETRHEAIREKAKETIPVLWFDVMKDVYEEYLSYGEESAPFEQKTQEEQETRQENE